VESCLVPALPATFDSAGTKAVKVFPKDAVTIAAFMDDAMVLASLQKPRKLTIRGSDGNQYGVLAKPKDDMRKDQRLMEFNSMINRFLKRDVEASKRRLYIKTYAVVPLNEECGLIEWVDNLKTFRDILLNLYKERRIQPNYNDIRIKLDQACANQPETTHIFKDQVLNHFPPVFHDWFVETFPDPSHWFNARLRYTRSAAVMSMVGHVLGLGDRHGENILFEEDNGGLIHVDFNCLFDKGLTFEKPECVPFRLSQNMVDAFGAYGYDGPFRKCSEITLTLLRNNEDALMTILETFLHDPTTDFLTAGKRKKNTNANTPDTPMAILDAVRGKVKGMLPGESVPLSVGGYVEEMIKQATDHANLCKMYIGWCAFF
jgi:serine/threonine-protein kinase ATR